MKIRTDHKWRNLQCYGDLSPKHQHELDWITDEAESVFVYKRWPFALDEFERIGDIPELKTWHGIKNETFFSGVVIRLSDDGEQYQVGNYYC